MAIPMPIQIWQPIWVSPALSWDSRRRFPRPCLGRTAIDVYLTATNTGPSNATNTVISDTLPTGLTFASGTYSVNGGIAQNVTTTGHRLDWYVHPIKQQSTVMTIIATVGATFVTGTH